MTTVQDVKRLVRPLLAKHENLILLKRFVIVTPVQHFVRGVFVERSSDPEEFKPMTFLSPLYYGGGSINFRYSEPLWRSWRVPDLSEEADFIRAFEDDAMPLLNSLNAIEKNLAFWRDKRRHFAGSLTPGHVYDYLALGDAERARAALAYPGVRVPLMTVLQQLGLADFLLRARGSFTSDHLRRIIPWLRENEERAIAKIGLAAYWDPRPFPIESHVSPLFADASEK